jgi:hypothetical protein
MPAPQGKEHARRRRRAQPAEAVDLFPVLIDRLADDLCALPADA